MLEKDLYRQIVESAVMYAIFTMDVDGIITTWNAGATVMMGFTAADMIGKDSAIIFVPEDRARHIHEQEIEQALATGSAPDKRWHLKKDGTRFFADGFLMPLQDSVGRTRGFLKILTDKTGERLP